MTDGDRLRDSAAFETFGALVVVLDLEQRVVWWSGACAELTGRLANEVLTRPFAGVLDPGSVEAVAHEVAARITTGGSGRSVHRWIDRDGAPRRVVMEIVPISGPDGLARYVVAHVVALPRAVSGPDGEHLRLAMAELAEYAGPGELERTIALAGHLMVERLADASFVELVRSDGRSWLARTTTRSGTPLSGPLERSLSELASACVVSGRGAVRTVADEHGRPSESLLGAPLRVESEVLGAQVLIRTPPSPPFQPDDLWLMADLASSAALAIRNAQRCDSGQQLILELREANGHMVAAVLRAHEENDAAAERERELRELGEMRELFLGVLGHDLRNPLGGIHWAATALVRGGRLSPEDARIPERILRMTRRVQAMITQLLDLVQIRRGGGFRLDRRPTDLRRLCPAVVEDFEEQPRLDVHGDVTGTWDPDRLEQALSNLARNAVEHATPGTRAVMEAFDQGEEVLIEVSNQGPPIPTAELDRIFEPFHRRGPARRGNLGLGLYIAHQIVQLHGGTLEGRSAGGTTTFRMRLPRTSLPPQGTIRAE